MRFGIDLGGTKTELIALDRANVERYRKRVPTPSASYDAILERICELVREAELELDATGSVGIATPGSISPASGLMRNANTVCLNGRAFDRDLSRALGREIRMANDANCFALSEASDGAGAHANVVFAVIMGTGCGAGVVVHGRLLEGASGVAGEWGHNPLPWRQPSELPGPACYCGKQGCIETFLSGPGVSRDHVLHGGAELAMEEIAARAQRADAEARATLDRLYDRAARALASVINVLDPDVIVLGGGLSQLEALPAAVMARLPAYVFSDCVRTRIARAVHGDSSGVRGAAWLYPLS